MIVDFNTKNELLNLIQSKAPGSKPLYLVVRGSHSYGTNIETSDVDFVVCLFSHSKTYWEINM